MNTILFIQNILVILCLSVMLIPLVLTIISRLIEFIFRTEWFTYKWGSKSVIVLCKGVGLKIQEQDTWFAWIMLLVMCNILLNMLLVWLVESVPLDHFLIFAGVVATPFALRLMVDIYKGLQINIQKGKLERIDKIEESMANAEQVKALTEKIDKLEEELALKNTATKRITFVGGKY